MTTKTMTLEQLSKTYIDLDEQIGMLQEQKKWLKDCIVLGMEKRGITKENGLQLVVSERRAIDDQAVKQILSAPMWKKVQADKVDPAKLDAAFKMGEIDPEDVSEAITYTEIKALRILQ